MKRIVHVCLNGIYTDGFTYQENILSKYHKKLGYDVIVVTNEYIYNESAIVKDNKFDYINNDGVRIIRIKTKNDKPFNYKFKKYPELWNVLSKLEPDILFIHGINFMDITILKKYLVKHNNCDAYVDNHCDWTNSGSNWVSLNILHKLFWRKRLKPIIPYVKKFYGVQPIRVDWLTKVYKLPADKCTLLIMGADDEYVEKYINYKSTIRDDFKIKEDDFLIVSGGKIDYNKSQVLDLMQAVNELNNNNIKLLVFGDAIPELKDKFNSLLSEKVLNFGWIAGPEKSFELFSVANLICFPGLHSVYWEQCVAQGKPLLCNKLDGVDHIDIGGNVVFFNSDSVESIKNAINSIVNDEHRYKDMVKAANNKKREDFLYSRIAINSIKE